MAWATLTILAGGAWSDDQQTANQTAADQNTAGAAAPLFFPRNFVRGFVDFQVAPPHNEIDMGVCNTTKANPFPNINCADFARYVWSGHLELQPMSRTPLRRLFLIFEPKVFAGNNVPQLHLTAAASPILWESSVGAGLELSRRFELRYTNHKAHLLGSYSGPAGLGSLRPDGPYGSNTTLGVRWLFGTWEHAAGPAPGAASHGIVSLAGFVDAEVAPTHDEVDLGLCIPTSAAPLTNTTCAAFARYVWTGYLELRPRSRTLLRRVALFFEPKVFLGNNVPQQHYNADASLILWESYAGFGIQLPKHFEFRFTLHGVNLLGRYSGPGGAATLRSDGPYGNYATVGLRWYFGGWEHAIP